MISATTPSTIRTFKLDTYTVIMKTYKRMFTLKVTDHSTHLCYDKTIDLTGSRWVADFATLHLLFTGCFLKAPGHEVTFVAGPGNLRMLFHIEIPGFIHATPAEETVVSNSTAGNDVCFGFNCGPMPLVFHSTFGEDVLHLNTELTLQQNQEVPSMERDPEPAPATAPISAPDGWNLRERCGTFCRGLLVCLGEIADDLTDDLTIHSSTSL